jgi:hypothetical protein
VPMLLQKSFCIDQHKFSGPYARRSNNHLRDYIICDELTGDFGNGLEVTSVGDCGSFGLFAGNCVMMFALIGYLSCRNLKRALSVARLPREAPV